MAWDILRDVLYAEVATFFSKILWVGSMLCYNVLLIPAKFFAYEDVHPNFPI